MVIIYESSEESVSGNGVFQKPIYECNRQKIRDSLVNISIIN